MGKNMAAFKLVLDPPRFICQEGGQEGDYKYSLVIYSRHCRVPGYQPALNKICKTEQLIQIRVTDSVITSSHLFMAVFISMTAVLCLMFVMGSLYHYFMKHKMRLEKLKHLVNQKSFKYKYQQNELQEFQ